MERVLVVEDTPAIADLMSRVLARNGYNVTTLSQGTQLLEYIHTLKPDIVLLDMSLPYKDGWTLIKEIRTEPSICHIPVIAVTAHTSEEDRKRAIMSGYNDFVCKPFDYRELVKLVDSHLRS